ncbi:MAG TPA: SIMPL domain-containing protein [Bacteroidales bacterium]|nr:SIMPL domain-containing protein [Bacteroidales bacterium]HRR49936.1 SIMPL domain-containing protein [Bacteroidales bacterium]HRT34487.1 SIMPL domain-containing protein [Bacteroidales bacterium]HRT84233.1 SIMPL domain-containing protein [Bacteroidales bacterium]
MKKICTVTTVLLVITLSLSAQEKNFIDQNYIEITASAEKEVSPNEIYISITIDEKDNKNNSLEKQERDMFSRLKALGIDLEKDMQVKDMETQLQEYFLKKNSVVTSKSYQLKISSTDLLFKVFKELEKMSIPNVNIIRTDVSDKESIKNDVMIMAVNKAKQRAELLANSVGRKLGKAIYIQHSEGYMRGNVVRNLAAGTKMMDINEEEIYSGPNLSFSKISFNQTVYVKFSLE